MDYYDRTLGHHFELSVSYLLSAIGFQVFFLGQPIHKKGIDLVALLPNKNKLLIISAHISNDIGEKIRTLIPELNKLIASLPGIQLIPAIFSPVKIDEIKKSDRSDAVSHGIALVLHDQIEQLFNLASIFSTEDISEKVMKIIEDSLINQKLYNESENSFSG